MTAEPITITQANSPDDIAAARELFEEYAAWLGFSLCFQNFDRELATLPGNYRPPAGRLLLARCNGVPSGCGALRPLFFESAQPPKDLVTLITTLPAAAAPPKTNLCEMKRLYVRPQFRGYGLGRKLTERLIFEARSIGYSFVRLDTIPGRMVEANRLYRELGFYDVPAYYHNPQPDVSYLELRLK
jgi:putative acetyltransferase